MLEDGFLLVDKESGWTSRDVCNKIRNRFIIKKVGHIGTLDPFATGLLIVSINKATKAGQFLENHDKSYLATLELGESRDGGDLTCELLEKKDIPTLTEEKIKEVLNSFIGEMDQVPPLKSAVHYQGRKLYEYAYTGEKVTPPSRKVTIYSLDLVSFNEHSLTFRCRVSKGTYIRVLGEDIAKRLGTLGYLSSLRRETVGDITLENARKIADIDLNEMLPVSALLKHIHPIYVDEILVDKAKRGLTIFFKNQKDDIVLLLDGEGNAIAVYQRVEGDLYKSYRGLF